MKKTLYLIRHAKTHWEGPETTDRDRSLTESGIQDAHDMGQALQKHGVKPDLIISSPAKRAIDTATVIAEELGYAADKIQTEELIYSQDVENIIELLKHLDNKLNTVLFFGHNPSLTWLTHYLCDEAKMNFPTCGIVGLEFKTNSWHHISDADTKVLVYLHPEHDQLNRT